jgi:hypothetical protein
MIRHLALPWLLLAALAPAAAAQTVTPQSSSGLHLTFSTERTGPTRVLIFGEVSNSTNSPCQRVVLLAEGLDESGRVVSRARGWVSGSIPSRGKSSFELRLLAAGSERRYRVQIEAFEFLETGN